VELGIFVFKTPKLAGFLSATVNVLVVVSNTRFYSWGFILAVNPKFQQIQAALAVIGTLTEVGKTQHNYWSFANNGSTLQTYSYME
jgi:hypothetical protein